MPDDHKLIIEFEPGCWPKVTFVHPESGCVPPGTCGHCGRDYGDPESDPCYDCKDYTPTACWLDGWADEASEYLSGKLTVPVRVTWDGDHPELEIGEREAPDAA